nr:Hsp-4 [Glaciozyma antarctica PI12]
MSSRKGSKQVSRAPSGTATPVVVEPQVPVTTVIGLNFGQSFSSIAVINKEGLADCIANDDGERQIASALSFNGTEEYSGVPARVQLVRNAENTILGFRNLLGKTFEEVKSVQQPYHSAAIVDSNGSPAFTVTVNGTPTTFTAHQVAVRYLSVLLSYATDFLGRKITGAVLSVPTDFSEAQTAALIAAAEEAGIKVLQTISETAAALTAYHSTLLPEEEKSAGLDRNAVVIDVGGSSTAVSVVAIRDGLFAPLAAVHDASLGGDLFDAKLMDWFSKEFTKKTRIALGADNPRALMKLRLSVEVTKKSLSASNSAPCSVESLAEGMDFHGSINRTRFDLLAAAIYGRIVAKVEEALAAAKVDTLHVQEIILVGGSTRLPTLADKLNNLFYPATPLITSQIDPDEVVAKGAALQALALVATYPLDSAPHTLLHSRSLSELPVVRPSFLSKPLGFVIDAVKDDPKAVNGRTFVVLVPESTPLPLRRIIDVDVPAGSGAAQVLLALWEGSHEIKVEQPAKKSKGGFFSRSKDEDEDDEDEPEEVRTALIKPEHQVADLVISVDAKPVVKGKAKSVPKVRLTLVINVGGSGSVSAVQLVDGAVETTTEF